MRKEVEFYIVEITDKSTGNLIEAHTYKCMHDALTVFERAYLKTSNRATIYRYIKEPVIDF